MNTRTVMAIACLTVIAGCENENAAEARDQHMEYEKALREEDKKRANATIARIPSSGEMPVPTARTTGQSVDLSGHPLARFFVPEGGKALDYFGKFYRECRPDKPHRHASCDAIASEAVAKAAHIGITATEADFKNPAYWQMHKKVYDMAKVASARITSSKVNLAEKNKLHAAFRAREIALFEQAGGK